MCSFLSSHLSAFLIHDTIQWLGSDHWLYTAFNEELWDTLNSGSVVKVL